MTLERVLSVGGATLVGAGALVLGVGAVELLATAVRYIGAGGLEQTAGVMLLPAGALAVLVVATSLAGVVMALRSERRFPVVSAASGIAMLGWSVIASGSSTRVSEFAWLVALGSGTGLLLLSARWLLGVCGGVEVVKPVAHALICPVGMEHDSIRVPLPLGRCPELVGGDTARRGHHLNR